MSDVRVTEDAFGRLTLTLASGEEVKGVVPVRAWPLSAPGELISLVGSNGQEVLMLRTLEELPAESRTLIERALSRREFMPEISQVLAASNTEPSSWHVATDRGEARFVLPSEDNIRAVGEGVILTDEHGVRYRIPDLRKLDKRSQKLISRHV